MFHRYVYVCTQYTKLIWSLLTKNLFGKRYPDSQEGVIAKAKNGDNQFQEQNLHMQPMRQLNLQWLIFFPWGKWGCQDRTLLFRVPTMFPVCYQMFSMIFLKFQMCFPRVFPIAPHLLPIHFAQSSSLLTYIPGPKGRHYISDRNFYFGKLLKLFF